MSVACILTPIVVAAWPAFGTAVAAAAASLGYVVADETAQEQRESIGTSKRIQLEIEQSEIVTGQLARDQKMRVMRDGITVTFSRDPRGRASLCVEGREHSEAELRAAGEELSRRVVQRYVYQRLIDEMQQRQFLIVEEQVQEDSSIRLKVRRWDN